MAITLCLHPLVQVPEVSLQVLPILLLRDPIHTYRGILPAAAIGGAPRLAHRSDAPVSGTVLRVPVSLVPLPSAVAVTSSPTSMRWSWFPPEVPISTGRLCSAGSESPTSSPTSKLLFGPPTPLPPSAAAPVPLASGLPRGRRLFCRVSRRPARAPADAPVSEMDNRLSVPPVSPEERQGLPGYGAVLFVRAVVQHPAGLDPSSPLLLC